MLRRKITTTGNSAALVLSQDLLGLMGVKVGDDVEIEVSGTSLIVRPIDEKRHQDLRGVAREGDAQASRPLRKLARGDGTPKPKSRSKP
jgi:antitoxin component of MazEF toxin-antitoxin module